MCNVKKSKIAERLLRVLRRTKFIYGFCKKPGRALAMYLRYHNGVPLIRGSRSISRPGSRVYADRFGIRKNSNFLNTAVISTSRYGFSWSGVLRKNSDIGGEVICSVW